MEEKEVLLKLRNKIKVLLERDNNYKVWDEIEGTFYDGKKCAFEEVLDIILDIIDEKLNIK